MMISDDDEDALLVVCVAVTTPLLLPDNLIAPCIKCGDLCQLRPHNPVEAKVICSECVIRAIDASDKVTATVTPETIREVRDYIRRKRN